MSKKTIFNLPNFYELFKFTETSSPFIKKFLEYNKKHLLIEKDDKILLAVSGGIDSMTLVNIFLKLNINFELAHFNYHLRGKDSVLDQELIEKIAHKNHLNLFIKEFDIQTYAKENQVSIQMAARNLRYDWFKELLKKFSFNKIATAHHLNDNIETILFNFIKGTGIAGLKGILPQNGYIIRPFLSFTKEEIVEFAKDNKLEWREDKSNFKNDYHRNLIRNKIIPIIKTINPNLEKTINNSIIKYNETNTLLEETVNSFKKDYFFKQGEKYILLLNGILKKKYASLIIEQIIKPFGFNFYHANKIVYNTPTKGSEFLSSQYKILFCDQKLIIKENKNITEQNISITPQQTIIDLRHLTLNISTLKADKYEIEANDKIAAFDYDKLLFPLKIRKWKYGDKFYPLGMKNKKKISDFLIDKKINIDDKRNIYVLLSEDKIIWVIGYRIDDNYKISEKTKTIYQIKIVEKN